MPAVIKAKDPLEKNPGLNVQLRNNDPFEQTNLMNGVLNENNDFDLRPVGNSEAENNYHRRS